MDFTAYQDAVAAIHALNGMPGAESPEEAAYSGSCGVGVSWVLENTGVMTISGSGRMNDYSGGSQVPWADHGFHTLIVEAGVTGIGSYAFRNNKYLTTVNLASGISIDSGAFAGCTDLQEIDLSMVSSIGYGAFDGCTSLSTVTISESISSISQNAFRNCSSL